MEQIFTRFEWATQRMARNCPSTKDFAEWAITDGPVVEALKKRDYEYSLAIGNYHSPWSDVSNDPSMYGIDIIEDVGFTVSIAGSDWIVGTVTITEKIHHHRTVTYLVAHPQECNQYLHYTRVDNNRW